MVAFKAGQHHMQPFNAHLLGSEDHEAIFYPKDIETPGRSLSSGLGLRITSDCPYSQTVINKFESRVVITDNGCWQWKGGKDKQGVGRFCIRKDKKITTARASFKIYRGDFGDSREIWIVRSPECSTVGCCNPAHLEKSDHPWHMTKRGDGWQFGSPGTRFQKGKEPLRGANAPGAKLTDLQVAEIRVKRLRDGTPFRSLAALYGVSARLIQRITKGDAWQHLPTDLEGCLNYLNDYAD